MGENEIFEEFSWKVREMTEIHRKIHNDPATEF
jgi:hypothetical protein